MLAHVAWIAIAIILFAIAPACARKGAASSGTEEGVLANSRIEPPTGVTLAMACTPTGPELCFNASDDNCNGVIDEGCGLATGILQFTIAWGESPADVDIVLSSPSGERITSANRGGGGGFRLERDCPKEDCAGQNYENVVFEGAEPPRGRYSVEIKLRDLKNARSPVKIRFGARLGRRTYASEIELSPADDRKLFSFEF